MEIKIEITSPDNVPRIQDELEQCCNIKSFGEWTYNEFSIGEKALYRLIDKDEKKTVIAFLIEELDDGCVLIPAHCKGEKEPPFPMLSACIVDVIGLVISNMWSSINRISIIKESDNTVQ